jgi:hypothetical protein
MLLFACLSTHWHLLLFQLFQSNVAVNMYPMICFHAIMEVLLVHFWLGLPGHLLLHQQSVLIICAYFAGVE